MLFFFIISLTCITFVPERESEEKVKRLLKWSGIALLVPVVLFGVLTALLYCPPVQNWAVRKVAAVASEKTGMDISVERVKLVFPLDLGLEGVRVMKPNDSIASQTDTVADIGRVVAEVQLLPLLKKQVEVDKLEISDAKLNTDGLIGDVRVKGRVGRLTAESHGIDLAADHVKLNRAELEDADLDIALADTVPPDTTESKNHWQIAADNVKIVRSRVKVLLPGDTLAVCAEMGSLTADGATFDLEKSEYTVNRLDWKEGALSYDDTKAKAANEGLDPNHVALTDITLGVDSLNYSAKGLSLSVRECAAKEKSGLDLHRLQGHLTMDDKRLHLPDLQLETSESNVNAHVVMDLNTFDERSQGEMHATLNAAIGKQDIVKLAGNNVPQDFKRKWPNGQTTVKGVVTGNMKRINMDGLAVNVPGAIAAKTTGFVTNPTDPDNLLADLDVDVKTQNTDVLTSLVAPEGLGDVRIPNNIGVKGRVKANGSKYTADITATEGGGTLKAKADLDTRSMTYTADAEAVNVNPKHFVPSLDATPFTGHVKLKGRGTDLTDKNTRLVAKADVKRFSYAGYDLSGTTASANVNNGRLHADAKGRSKLFNGNISFDGLANGKGIDATIGADVVNADLQALGLSDRPLRMTGCLHADVKTDMKNHHKLRGTFSDIVLRDSSQIYRPDDMTLDVLLGKDTTHVVADCGDFHLRADADGNYEQLIQQSAHIADRMKDFKNFDRQELRSMLPTADIQLETGNTNILAKILERKGYTFQDAQADITCSPATGLNGDIAVNRLTADSIQLDTIRLVVESDSSNVTYHGVIQNNENNPQYVFKAVFDGNVLDGGGDINLTLYDADDRKSVRLGATAEMNDSGVVARLKTDNPILGYKTFSVNDDNYVFLANDNRVSAKLNLQAADGQGVQIYTNDDHTDALQDITVGLHKFDLESVLSVIPYAPDVRGIMDGDFHVIQGEKDLAVSSSLAVDNLIYERSPMGNISTEFVYIPKGDGAHYMDGVLYKDEQEIGSVVGTYDANGQIDAALKLIHTPLSLANGFIEDHIIGFAGYADGDLSVKGTLNEPVVNGTLTPDSSYLLSEPYGLSLRLEDEPMNISGSKIVFKDYALYAYNENPIRMTGNVDFSRLDHMKMDLRMRAENTQIIKAKETPRSVAFGSAFVNFFGGIHGDLDNLKLRGKLDVLSTTDLSYILRDSPLTTDNQLDELVKFTDFSDATDMVVTRPAPSGIDMDMTIDVSNGAHVMAYLNSDHSNFIDLMGGGTLRMKYNNADNLRLTGKYTLNDGQMKYALPIIPLKTFNIKNGSYLEFTGDPMNPKLNITATETITAPVANDNGVGQSKTFECGVSITKTLQDMGLEFILSAEDQNLQEELQSMGAEQRSKLAVSLLATGMYLADGNTNTFSMNSALSAFLNSQINNVTGNALRTLDLSVGVDNSTDVSGNTHMDYSFKFAKRFWNNRLKVSVGGKVTTGSEISDQDRSFFDNLDVEYRLDNTANKYLTGFYKNNVFDWLEGYSQQYGVGFTWKRTLNSLGDIFRFKNEEDNDRPPMHPDSLRTDGREDSLHVEHP